jgi:hypothetical protein
MNEPTWSSSEIIRLSDAKKTVEDALSQTRITHRSSPFHLQLTATYHRPATSVSSCLMGLLATMVVDKVHVSHAKALATSR